MKTKIINLFKKKFIRNVILMASGAAGAQAITMALSPVITRLYGPDAFGVMGTFTSITRIIIPIAALTYPIAIVLPRNDEDAKGLIRLSLTIASVISFVLLIVISLVSKPIINTFNLKDVANYLYLIPLVVIFAGIMQTSEQWLIRTKQFSINARVTFLQSAIINGSKVGFGLFYPVAPVLVVLNVLSNGVKAAMMILFAKRSNYNEVNDITEERKNLKELAKTYFDFPTYRAPEVFLNAVSNGLPVLILTAFFGPASAGFYTICRTVLNLPSQLIGKSVGDVFYPRIAEASINKENLTDLIKKATLALSGVGIIPFGIIILFGPTLFSFVFGSDWVVAGEYARWIALWSFVGFMNTPSVQALPVLNAQRFHLIYTIIMLIIRTSALAIGYYLFKSDVIAISFFGIAGAILNIGLIIITLRISVKKKL